MKRTHALFLKKIWKDSNMRKKQISLEDFKNWLYEQKDINKFMSLDKSSSYDDPNEEFIGKECKTKVSEKKILEKIETEEDKELLARDFIEEGGFIISTEGKKLQIEVDSGVFKIPKFCVKII